MRNRACLITASFAIKLAIPYTKVQFVARLEVAMGGKGSKQQKSEPKGDEKTSPLDHFNDGAIVFLTCKASGKLLRIHEDRVDVS